MTPMHLSLRALLLAAGMLAAGALPARSAEPTLSDLDRAGLFERAIAQRFVARPERLVRFAESGAASSNVDFEDRKTDKWFIEGQRYGGDLVEAGLLVNDHQTAKLGWKLLDWGFARQSADGSFAATGDPFHSTSFFVEAAARALLLEQEFKSPAAGQRLKHYRSKLAAAAHWMLRPDVLDRGLKNNQPYTHRRWLVAAGWGMAGRVLEDRELVGAAILLAQEGIDLQKPDGVNPEKGGFDVSYQAVGLLMAERYDTVCDDPLLRKSIAGMLARGLNYELTKIDADGDIDLAGSTRVTSETSRSGAAKTVDHRAIVASFVYGAKLLKKPEYEQAAERVARRLQWLKD